MCVCVCPGAYVFLCQHRAAFFEVCLLCRSRAENTGTAICDTIDTWHVNIDNNSVVEPPAGLPFLTFTSFGCRHSDPLRSQQTFFLI